MNLDLNPEEEKKEGVIDKKNTQIKNQKRLGKEIQENYIITKKEDIEDIKERIKNEKKRELSRLKYLEKFKNIRFQYLISPKHENYNKFLKEGLEYPVVPDRLLPNKTDVAYERDGIPQLVCN